MNSFSNLNSFKTPTNKTVVTIGTFDGVHIGHEFVLKKVIELAQINDYKSTVLTFFPHPRMVLQQDSSIKLLNTIKEKENLLSEIGIDNLIIHPFDLEFSRLSAEEFVKDVLIEKLNVGIIIIGHDHRFGRNRTANIDDLIEYGIEYGFEVQEISAKEIDDIAISSTKIRTALLEGNITTANNYLGYNYFMSGKVVHGKQIGRTIDFPTANIEISEDYKLIPKNGVYIVSSEINNTTYFGMMNIGTNPTVDGLEQKIEVHFFDFNADIYNQDITVQIHSRIRDEKKYNSLDELKVQLQKDELTSRIFIKNNL
ncbi:bifunctional riboflavin kinase/FAD synthetase [Flavobacterium sp. N2270]|uniref:bifunctional riboflavin kinase/FAD synthetase n=1 Tax=Flavobacterium sp. N2270 TaxID=2986831 RepID=UPI002224DA76|nr:bifunctional riboflavin kinase/FAD synthetase [Flavobacterium sp. N2270]